MKKSFTAVCIVCPNGCRLTVSGSGDEMTVAGNKCPRGKTYGIAEAVNPTRVVTCVVPTVSEAHPVLPVKTDGPVPKNKINRLLKKLYALRIKLPVKTGDVVFDGRQGYGAKVVATRDLS